MRMHFTMVINGKETIETKFEEKVKSNPNLHMDLIRCMAHTIMLAFGLDEKDELSVESFRAGKIPDEMMGAISETNSPTPEMEKKVDN